MIFDLTKRVGGGGELPSRLVKYIKLTMPSTATSVSRYSVQLEPLPNSFVVVMADKDFVPDTTNYKALFFSCMTWTNTITTSIKRPNGTYGTDQQMGAFDKSTGVLALGGQYGYYLAGDVYHVYQFEFPVDS